MKICVVCASGGHLTEMSMLASAFRSHDAFLVTYKEKFVNIPKNINKTYFIKNIMVNHVDSNRLFKLILFAIQGLILIFNELYILVREKPNIIVSTGSEIAIPICYIGKLFRMKIIFIESLCRIEDLSFTGKMVAPISDSFFVQWENLLNKHHLAEYRGNLISQDIFHSNKNLETSDLFVFVTVGTASFPRLIQYIDKMAEGVEYKVIMQIGKTSFEPKHSESFDFKDYIEMCEYAQKAKIIVSHGGIGSILMALEQRKPLIIVPRLKELGECNDNHQLEIAKYFTQIHFCHVAYNAEDIFDIINDILSNYSSDIYVDDYPAPRLREAIQKRICDYKNY